MRSSLEELLAAYDPDAPLSRASTPPCSWYTDERIFALEKHAVFGRSWQVVGRVDQLAGPGDYITCDVAGEPLVIVKGSDRLVRGFFNVCRHHAAIVATEPSGTIQTLRCPYHGWTYDLQGNLIGTPDFAGVIDFDRSANGLVSVPISLWGKWIFARLNRDGISLRDHLGGEILESAEEMRMQDLYWFERRRYTIACNWKVFVDNYLDGGYHVPQVHDALNSVLDYKNYTMRTGERVCIQSGIMTSNSVDRETVEMRHGATALYLWIYPNLMINWYEGVMDTNVVYPRTADTTDVIFDFYFSDVSDNARARNLRSIALSERIQAEDKSICESVERGLHSRAYNSGRLSVRREAGEHLFHRLLHADLKANSSRHAE